MMTMSKLARFLALILMVGAAVGSTGCESLWDDDDLLDDIWDEVRDRADDDD